MPAQNRVLYSNDFSNAAWSKSGAGDTNPTVAQNATAPDGTTTAWTLTDGAQVGVSQSLLLQSFAHSAPVGAMVCSWACLKAGTKTFAHLFDDDGSAQVGFNLSTGAWQIVAGATRAGTVSLGNGWWLCWVTHPRSTGSPRHRIYIATSLTVNSYQGTGTGTILVWRAQAEQGNYPGDYVATTTAAVDAGAPPNKRLAQNLIRYSEDYTNAVWSSSGDPAAADIVSPLGTTTKGTLMEAAANIFHDRYLSAPFTGCPLIVGATYCFSAYLKALGRSNTVLYVSDGGNASRANFNISTGAVVFTGGTNFKDAKIVSVGGGWFRAWVVHVYTGALNYLEVIKMNSAGDAVNYAGDITKGIGCFGAQYEIGDAPGDYQPTTSVAMS